MRMAIVAWQIACYLRKEGTPAPPVSEFMAGAWLPGVLAERDRRIGEEDVADTLMRERKRASLAFSGLFARARAAHAGG